MTYEATMDLEIAQIKVQTPLTITEGNELTKKIGLVPILRAGLGDAGDRQFCTA